MSDLAVVIPALNEATLIRKTLESLNNQTKTDFFVVVVDNGSSDQTINIVKEFAKQSKYSLHVISEPKLGVGYARNTGSKKAIERGAKFLAGTDADTTVPPNWVESIYTGFETSQGDLLCGECDPLSEFKTENKQAMFAFNVRSVIFKAVKPYCRGANFAITTTMFEKIGGIKQPLNSDGTPAVGEDGRLEIDVLEAGGVMVGCLATVCPHPRRYISNLQKLSEFSGRVHIGGSVSQVRNEDELVKTLASIPNELIDEWSRKIVGVLFIDMINLAKNPVFKAKYLGNIVSILAPFTESEISKDVLNLTEEALWLKYKEAFLTNVTKLIPN